jgi:hypothetical protein
VVNRRSEKDRINSFQLEHLTAGGTAYRPAFRFFGGRDAYTIETPPGGCRGGCCCN